MANMIKWSGDSENRHYGRDVCQRNAGVHGGGKMTTLILIAALWAMEITGVGDVLDPVIRPVPVFTPVPGDGNQVIDDIQIYGGEMVIEIQSNNPIEIDQSTDGKCVTITAR